MILTFIISFMIGVSIGSFLNVLIDRLSREETIIFGRSHCDFCKHTLSWSDLIPVLSYFLLGGRCRYCRKKFSVQYPLVEFMTGMMFVFAGMVIDSGNLLTDSRNLTLLIYWFILLSCLLVIFVADMKYHIIPDEMVILLICTTILYGVFFTPGWNGADRLVAGCVFSALFLLLVVVTGGKGMGVGDVKYAFFMGLFLGIQKTIVAFYLAFLTGALISLILIGIGKKRMKSTIAFGPFLVVATLVSAWWGDSLFRIFIMLLGI